MTSDWLTRRLDATPPAFRPWMEVDDSAGTSDDLLGAGVEALRDGLAGRGAHDGAFRLLAADGLLTWACERALDGEDPRRELRGILASLSG